MFNSSRKSIEAGSPARSAHDAVFAPPQCEQLEDRLLLSLLGVGSEINTPNVYYDAWGYETYTASTDEFFVNAAPIAVVMPDGTIESVRAYRDLIVEIKVDQNGNLISGTNGADLVIEGEFRSEGMEQYGGTMLTGEIIGFGYLDTGTVIDQYDFRFRPTGGTLMPFFEGKDIGMVLTARDSTFEGSFAENFVGYAYGVIGAIDKFVPVQPGSLAGRVYLDANNNGVDDGEAGVAGVTVALAGADFEGNAVALSAVTDADGAYLFADVMPGTYSLSETQPAGLLDGIDSAGSLGGAVADDVISEIVIASGADATGYNFGELAPASLSGLVFEDFNVDGEVNFGEKAIDNVTVTLTGTDDRGDAVSLSELTGEGGIYSFVDLRPGDYTVTETQPAGYADGLENPDVLLGVVGDDVYSNINLTAGYDGMNYNFAERPVAGGEVAAGQTATIGFWQNKNGQKLLKALNGGSDATNLGAWLAATLPNMYGADAGDHNLDGMTNAEIASLYRELFKAKVKGKNKTGPRKVDAQVMATALAVYVTNETLAATTAEAYGFLVSEYGLGAATFNVGDCGAAFGVADGTEISVLDMLRATDSMAVNGSLYDLDAVLRQMANEIYSSINEAGDIG